MQPAASTAIRTCGERLAGLATAVAVTAILAGCAPQGSGPAAAYRIYASNEISGDLSVIDGASGKVVASVPLGKRPRGVVVSPDGRFIYVALSGSPIGGPNVDESKLPPPDKQADGVGVVNAASLTVVRVLRGVSDPEQLAISPDGKTLYLASQDANQVVATDAESGRILATAYAGGEPEGIAVSPDGGRVYASSEEGATVTAFGAPGLTPLGRIGVGERARGIAFAGDGKRAFVTGENDSSLTEIDVPGGAALRKVKLPGAGAKPMGVVVAPGGGLLFVTTGRGGMLLAVDPATLGVVGQAKVGARPWGVAISPDGKRLFTANGPSGDVSELDAASLKLLRTIKVGDRPWGVAVGKAPGG